MEDGTGQRRNGRLCGCSGMAGRRRWEVVVNGTSWLRHFGVHYLLQRTFGRPFQNPDAKASLEYMGTDS